MTSTARTDGLLGSSTDPLVRSYDLAMLDLDGVVYVGSQEVPDAPEHVRSVRAAGMRVAFITNNAARPPAEVAAFFRAGYPSMAGVAENLERARAAGFDVIDQFTLPTAAWWDQFYTPLEERMAQLAPGADPALAATIDETRHEIAMYRRHGDSYGYVFYLLRRGLDAD